MAWAAVITPYSTSKRLSINSIKLLRQRKTTSNSWRTGHSAFSICKSTSWPSMTSTAPYKSMTKTLRSSTSVESLISASRNTRSVSRRWRQLYSADLLWLTRLTFSITWAWLTVASRSLKSQSTRTQGASKESHQTLDIYTSEPKHIRWLNSMRKLLKISMLS